MQMKGTITCIPGNSKATKKNRGQLSANYPTLPLMKVSLVEPTWTHSLPLINLTPVRVKQPGTGEI